MKLYIKINDNISIVENDKNFKIIHKLDSLISGVKRCNKIKNNSKFKTKPYERTI